MGDARRVIAVIVQYAGPAAWLAEVLPSLNADVVWLAAPPAAAALARLGVSSQPLPEDPSDRLAGADILVTGTSLGPGPEKRALRGAARLGLPSVSVVDHWSNYRERFEDEAGLVWPDHILVNDDAARGAAEAAGLPAARLRPLGNPVLERRAANAGPSGDARSWRKSLGLPEDRRVVVFVSEDLARHFPEGRPSWHGFDEYRALEDLQDALPPDAELIVKTHPNENPAKYANRLGPHSRAIASADSEALISFADKIVGMGSMLLLEAAARRGDILAYRPNQRVPFIGVETGAVRGLSDREALRAALEDRTRPSPSAWGASFKGSRERIARFLTETMA